MEGQPCKNETSGKNDISSLLGGNLYYIEKRGGEKISN